MIVKVVFNAWLRSSDGPCERSLLKNCDNKKELEDYVDEATLGVI